MELIESQLKENMERVSSLSVTALTLIKQVASSYTSELDELMQSIYTDVVSKDQPPVMMIEKHFLNLSDCLYMMGEKLESLGVYSSMSNASYKEVYNEKYLSIPDTISDSKKKLTVADMTALTENATKYESVTSDIYSKAYKIVKSKVESATTMLSTLSKILSRRMSEMQLNSVAPSGRQILNEVI